MSQVVNSPSGTAIYSKIDGIEMCGKTGTVQNPHGADHSVFVAFAPRENPKIAIAVVVENAGFGSTWSAPIASLMVEKYLTRTISKPKAYLDRLLEANLLPGEPVKTKAIAKKPNTPKRETREIIKPVKLVPVNPNQVIQK
jgi:penicillin-binding protein 2